MEAALDEQLRSSSGFPLEGDIGVRLRPIPAAPNPLESILNGVYWMNVKEPAKVWIKRQRFLDALMAKVVRSPFAPGFPPPPFPLYHVHPGQPHWIGVPKFFGLSAFGRPQKDKRIINPLPAPLSIDGLHLRPEQQRAVNQTLASLKEWGGATLIASCGVGKTAMAIAIAVALNVKTLVLCNRTVLMRQWKGECGGAGPTWESDETPVTITTTEFRTLCATCNKPSSSTPTLCCCSECVEDVILPARKGWIQGARVGWLQGAEPPQPKRKRKRPPPKFDVEDKDIVIASIASVAECGYSRDLLSQFSLVIVDEMHHLAAKTLTQVLPQLPARYVLGLTATPTRADGLEYVLYHLAGPTSFVYIRTPAVTGKLHTVEVRCLEVESRYSMEAGFANLLTSLSNDAARNSIIVEAIARSVAEGRQRILCISNPVLHGPLLRDACIAAGIEAAEESVCLSGGVGASTLRQAKLVRIVFATYGLLSEGYDDPQIDTLILATPRSNVQQSVGRVERTHPGKLLPIVYDVVDSCLRSMHAKRLQFYKSMGYVIHNEFK